ncbi:MAG: serine hydrolase [Gemmatimonadales bacterium]
MQSSQLGDADALWLLALALLVSCGGTTEPRTADTRTVEITASADTLTFLGQQQILGLTVKNAAGDPVTPSNVTWASRAPAIVSVDATGTVQARANGEATIVVTAETATDSIVMTVAQEAANITISGVDTVFALGVHARLTARAVDAGGSDYTLEPLRWSSGDEATVTVDQQGRVLPLAAGLVGITVSAGDFQSVHLLAIEDAIPLEVGTALADSLQFVLEDVSSANGVIGVQGAVIIPGTGTWVGVFGRSGEATVMRPDMAVPIGSVAKTVISGLVLHLVDQGLLSLDDTVGDLLPPFTNPNVTPGATVRQLLQNTSGIASYSSAPGFVDSLLVDRNRVWTPAEVVETFVTAAEFSPGATWKSSNTGYLLGGMIAEAVTGQSLPDLYASEIYGPLGLQEIFLKDSEPARATTSETWNGPAGGPFENFTDLYDGPSFSTGLWPLGNLVVNARTLASWGEGLFGDFLSPAVRNEMLTAVPDDGRIPNEVGAGIGVRKFDFLQRTQWGHSGTVYNGSGFLLYDEASGIVVALVYNQPGGSHSNSHFTLVSEMLRLALAGN